MQVQPMFYVVPRTSAQALQGSNVPSARSARLTVWGVFATEIAAWAYIAQTNRRLCATVVAL